MSFLLAVLPEGALDASFDEAWESHSSSPAAKPASDVRARGWRLRLAPPASDSDGELWREGNDAGSESSFVYVSGWCYRSGTSVDGVGERECRAILARHRLGKPPLTDEYFGTFYAVIYDHLARRVAIVPDRFAMAATYFTRSSAGIAVSDRALAVGCLIGAPVDGHSLIALMRGIHIPFGRSFFANVNRVLCGCYLDLDLKSASLAVRRWVPLYTDTTLLPRADALDMTATTLRLLSHRITSAGHSAIDLTGGNDTRLFAAAVDATHPAGLPRDVSWRVAGGRASPDVVVAQRIAEVCAWPLKVLDRYGPDEAATARLPRLAQQADGSFTVDTAFGRVRQEEQHSTVGERLVGSIGGELLRGFFWRHEMLALGRSSNINYRALLAYRLYDTNGVDPRALAPDAPSHAEHDEVLLAPYRQLDTAGGQRLNPYKLDVLYLHKLCYSAGNAHSWLADFRRVKLPLLNSEVCASALAFPWRWRRNRQLVLQLIARLSPRLSAIPNDKQEPMVVLGLTSWPSYAAAGARLSWKTLNRMRLSYMGRSAGGTTTSLSAPPLSWQATLMESKRLPSAVDPSFLRSISSALSSTNATADTRRGFYVLLTTALLLDSTRGLTSRLDFSSEPARVVP